MKEIISVGIWHAFILLLLLREDRNDGGKDLFKRQTWNFKDVLIVLISIDVFTFILYSLKINKYFNFYPFLSLHIVLILLLVFIVKIRYKEKLKSLGISISKKTIIYGLCGGILDFLIIYAIYYVFGDIEKSFYHAKLEIASINGFFDYIFYLSTIILIGPAIEESIFRGILYSPYRKKYGIYGGIFINAFIFAVTHYGMPVIPFIFGEIILSAVYEKTETIIAPFIAHSIYNTFYFLLGLYYLSI